MQNLQLYNRYDKKKLTQASIKNETDLQDLH